MMLEVTEVPACNEVQCGWLLVILEGAKALRKRILDKRNQWDDVLVKAILIINTPYLNALGRVLFI